jgi:hypothetical protein
MLEESLKYAALLVIKQGSRMSGRQCTVFQLRAPLCNFQKKKQTNLQTKLVGSRQSENWHNTCDANPSDILFSRRYFTWFIDSLIYPLSKRKKELEIIVLF